MIRPVLYVYKATGKYPWFTDYNILYQWWSRVSEYIRTCYTIPHQRCDMDMRSYSKKRKVKPSCHRWNVIWHSIKMDSVRFMCNSILVLTWRKKEKKKNLQSCCSPFGLQHEVYLSVLRSTIQGNIYSLSYWLLLYLGLERSVVSNIGFGSLSKLSATVWTSSSWFGHSKI